ncbi:MAG: glycosyltransferase family 2 protein [Acidiferrobacterales bacterium]
MNNVSQPSPGEGNISILMCTFQGEKHLLEQLESIREQTYRNWQLFVSDDGSTDETLAILHNFQASLAPGQMEIFDGPRRGFAANFMSLLLNPSIEGSYYAFSDQDDFWCDDKLSEAVSKLKSLSGQQDKPAVYASARTLVDDDLKPIGKEGARRLIPSFKNALAQNIAGGNTIVLNKKMRAILLKIGAIEVVSHDWWIYLVCTGADGIFYYDEEPHLLYRQHSNNVIGSGFSSGARLNRLRQFCGGRYRRWIDINLNALERSKWALTNNNVVTMEKLASLRDKPAPSRVLELLQSGIHRQSWLGTAGLLLACLLKMV